MSPSGIYFRPSLIYYNDISTCVSSEGKLIIYADDCTYLGTNDSPDGLVDGVNYDLACLAHWYESNKHSFDRAKIKLIIFGKSGVTQQIRSDGFEITSVLIKMVSEFNILDALFDDQLHWTGHINMITSKLGTVVGLLWKVRNFHSRKWHMSIYNTFVLPYMNFIWAVHVTLP